MLIATFRYYFNIETGCSQQQHPNLSNIGAAIMAKLELHRIKLQVTSLLLLLLASLLM
jgi:hypothetical protein